jgi:predicted N-acetyltransferase YhbS
LKPPRPLHEAGDLDLAGFTCGNAQLDAWLRFRAIGNDARAFSRVFVLANGRELIGYYTLSAYTIARRTAPRTLRHGAPDPVAAILLGQLAVAESWHGRGVGASLLQDAIRRFSAAAEIVAARLLVTHPIDAAAASFYSRHGWSQLDASERRTMYVLLEQVRDATL